ncbi:flavin reductase family protein [Streptomyces sp. NPDC002896]|uniref:flavin reductase family protein n=1 Tax=Streptomyces sp. NPDC002896 TaxID=3154438 RepID=UPI00331D5F4D
MPPATADRPPSASMDAGFLDAMAALAGGVCIVTTLGEGGRPAGFTSTAAMSLSRSPQLLAIGVDGAGRTLPLIRRSGRFALNILGADGESVARRFAGRTADRFAGLEWTPDHNGLPLLTEYSSHVLACRVEDDVPAGDHRLLIAAVEAITPGLGGATALVHLGRRYHTIP